MKIYNKIRHSYVLLLGTVIFSSVAITSCDSQLDIVPKGKTTLESTADLEALLNQEYDFSYGACADLGVVCDEGYGQFVSVPEVLSQPNTIKYAIYTYDENVDRASLTSEDTRYEAIYKYINYANVILDKIDDASNDGTRSKEQIKAEARIIRAYMHFMAVNIYAQQYDSKTAAEKGGIAYVDNTDVSTQKTKLTLEETYKRILEDCSDDVIAALPDKNSNVERADKALGNAVRAHVLFQMKRYADALPYAQASLQYNGTIEDRSKIMETETWEVTQDAASNLLYIGGDMRVCPTYDAVTPATFALFEEGDYVLNYDYSGGWDTMFGEMFSGIPGSALYAGWDARCNVYGITSDRMYYLTAECLIRTGKIQEGLKLVDRVRKSRVEDAELYSETYADATEQEAMALLQRAKWVECIGSFENFFDCKRWNTEDNYKRTINRDLGEYGQFNLAPDSKLWVFPFPLNATRTNPSLTQNY